MKRICSLCVIAIAIVGVRGQSINLAEQLKSSQIQVINRNISTYERDGIQLDARSGDGIAVLEDLEFMQGTVTLEIKGENAPGRSFLGFAFNIQNDSTYEVVYFRPFNFVASEAIRKSHMVQYIRHPEYTWFRLRQERTGEYESEISHPPDPDEWFKATLVITPGQVQVFVNDEPNPDLVVDRLCAPASSSIGLWTGYGSSGRFRDLVLSAQKQ